LGVLYIVSTEAGAGKSAISAGIAANLHKKSGKGAEETTIAEGILGNQANREIKDKKARVIAVEVYGGQLYKSAKGYKEFGKDFLGVIINKVPPSQIKQVKKEAAQKYEEAGIKVLGIIPEDRMLLSLTIGELAESINGKILNNADKADNIVENYMLGALTVDSGADYFARKSSKAAVVHSDRSDMQLAALETPTACLVLSGGKATPIYSVMNKAAHKGVPVITTDKSVPDIIESIERSLQSNRLRQGKKLAKLADIVKQNLDLKVLA
jgi:BioD-like phosphotransacetylase family protein